MFFFSCEEEPVDTSGYNCTPDGCFADAANAQYLTIEDCSSYCNPDDYDGGDGGDSANWSFGISLNGNTYAASGSTTSIEIYSSSVNFGYAVYSNGQLNVSLAIRDITETTYMSGGYIGLTIGFDSPFIDNTAYLSHFVGMLNNDIFDYFSGMPFTCSDTIINEGAITVYQGCNVEAWDIAKEGSGGGNVVGTYSGTLYSATSASPGDVLSTYETPVEFEISFNVPRLQYN